jgi:hypothetical protein
MPIVPVRRSRSGRGLIVDECPHCFERHIHGAAGKSGPGEHGHRVAHCRSQDGNCAGYDLIERLDEPS